MARNIVLHEGQLSVAVESYEQVEMAQLEAEVAAKQEAVNSLQAQLDTFNAQHAEATVALEDSKSDKTLADRLVAESAVVGDEPTNDDGSVDVDITVADTAPEL